MRLCAETECGADISDRHGLAKLCDPCVKNRRLESYRKRNSKVRAAKQAAKHGERACSDCKVEISGRHGNANRCEPCVKEKRKARAAARARAYRAANPEKARASDRAWYAANLEKKRAVARASMRARREANPEKALALALAWYTANHGKVLAQRRVRRASNHEKVLEQERAWREANPEKMRAYTLARRVANPEKIRAYTRARRARKLNQIGTVRPDVEAYLLGLQGARCAAPWCGKALKAKPRDFHLDHINPLSRGGLHDDANLQLLCAPCNQRKSATKPEDWLMENGALPLVPDTKESRGDS